MNGYIAAISVLLAASSALITALTYWRNSNTKRAEFLLQLHQAFFIAPTYKTVRTVLDDTGDEARARVQAMIDFEASELTDFLNFFEMVAYFEASRTLRRKDVTALVGYYLSLMRAHRGLRSYIGRPEASFEHLNRQFARLK